MCALICGEDYWDALSVVYIYILIEGKDDLFGRWSKGYSSVCFIHEFTEMSSMLDVSYFGVFSAVPNLLLHKAVLTNDYAYM